MKKIVLLISLVTLVSCNDRIKPSGNIVSMERETGEFTALEVHSGINATVTMVDEPGLTVTADDNIISDIETYKRGETLIVKVRRNVSIRGEGTLDVAVRAVCLTGISGSDGSSVKLTDGIKCGELRVALSGGSHWEGGITANSLEAELSGGSVMSTGGSSNELDLECSGGSEFNWDSYGFSADVVKADLSDGSDAKARVGTSLDVEASGGSRFRYKGDPEHCCTNTSGGSVVESAD